MRLLTLNPPPPLSPARSERQNRDSSWSREPGGSHFRPVVGGIQKTENGSAVQSSGNRRACERFGASQGGLLTVRGGGGGDGALKPLGT